jgi:hypothetical protein
MNPLLSNQFSSSVTYGKPVNPVPPSKVIPYDGSLITVFVLRNGADPKQFLEILRDSRIGSIFDLKEGTGIIFKDTQSQLNFSQHPEA